MHQTLLNSLEFVKHLYNVGCDQAAQPRPMNSACLLTFHDSIEHFLYSACQRHDVKVKENASLRDYLTDLEKKLGQELHWKDGVISMNRHRRELKHRATFPSNETIQQVKFDVERFYQDNTPILFDTAFQDISMLTLVGSERVKIYLERSQKFSKQSDYKKAVEECALAFFTLIDEFQSKASQDISEKPFSFGNTSKIERAFERNVDNHGAVREFIDSHEKIGDTLRLLCIGIDYKKYAKFQLLTPPITKFAGGNISAHSPFGRSLENLNREEYLFCYNFVIESAMVIQSFEIDSEALTTTRTMKKIQEWQKAAEEKRREFQAAES